MTTIPGTVNMVRASSAGDVGTVVIDMIRTLSCDVLALSELRDVRDELAGRGVRLVLENPPPSFALLLEACGLVDASRVEPPDATPPDPHRAADLSR